jgi:hypothetical protein
MTLIISRGWEVNDDEHQLDYLEDLTGETSLLRYKKFKKELLTAVFSGKEVEALERDRI